jgi:glucose-1-phosphate adenylyltransferase
MPEIPQGTPIDKARVLVMILAGGEGRRLGPLTLERTKPAVPFAGRYRIIDIVLSNFINSGLQRIKVLTQYKSASLEEHIARGWRLSSMLDGFIETIPAQQRTGKSWFKGSADAVYQCLHVIVDDEPERVCVFGADHVYKMHVGQMLDAHVAKHADVTVAAIPMPREQARAFGVLEIDDDGRVLSFHEKVADPPTIPGRPGLVLASMGNYVFKADVLVARLRADADNERSRHDFGRDVLPAMVQQGDRVFAYDFRTNHVPGEVDNSYWRDIGTIDAYFEAQMDLVSIKPLFNCYNRRWPIRTRISHDPPAKFVFRDETQARVGVATDSSVSLGCIISGARIHRSVLGSRCRINSFSDIDECVLFDDVVVGRHAKIRRAIIDKGVEIPAGARIGYDIGEDRRHWHVSEGGIVVIPKRAVLPHVVEDPEQPE